MGIMPLSVIHHNSSDNFDNAFLTKLGIRHLLCNSMISKHIYYIDGLILNRLTVCWSRFWNVFTPYMLIVQALIICCRLAPRHTFIRCKILNNSLLSDVQLQLAGFGLFTPANNEVSQKNPSCYFNMHPSQVTTDLLWACILMLSLLKWKSSLEDRCESFRRSSSDLHLLVCADTYTYIRTQTTSPLFLISVWNSSLFTSDEREVGGGRERWQNETEKCEKGWELTFWVLLKRAL